MKTLLMQINADIESRIRYGSGMAFVTTGAIKEFFMSDMMKELSTTGNISIEDGRLDVYSLGEGLTIKPHNVVANATMIAYSDIDQYGNQTFLEENKELSAKFIDELSEFKKVRGPILLLHINDNRQYENIKKDELSLGSFVCVIPEPNSNNIRWIKSIKMAHIYCGNTHRIPKCLKVCDNIHCDMHMLHCKNRAWPPMDRCAECGYWFPNKEKEEDKLKRGAII